MTDKEKEQAKQIIQIIWSWALNDEDIETTWRKVIELMFDDTEWLDELLMDMLFETN